MQVRSASGVRRWSTALLTACAVVAVGCGKGDDTGVGPDLPQDPPQNPQIRQTAFIFDVNLRDRTVKVTSPAVSLNSLRVGGLDASVGRSASKDKVGPSFSLIGGDAIELTTSNFQITAGGGFPSGTIPVGPCPGGSPAAVPGRLCVEFDVSVINELGSVQLVGPTIFPAPPAGSTGPLMFPFDVAVTTTQGGVSTGGPQGNDVIIETPSTGEVTINDEWAGAPHNFFNDNPCPAGAGTGTAQAGSDCFRYEEITPTPLAGGASSDSKTVGFYLDPTVGQYRVRVIVAADLQNQSGALSGSISGTVTSPQLGPIVGATLTVTGVAGTQTSGAGGAYGFPTVGLGSRTVTITGGLPAGCTIPPAQATTVTNGANSVVDFSVTCPGPVGTIQGTISSSLGGTLSGVSVTVTPAGGSALAVVSTNGSGLYSRNNVPLGTPTGTGSIALSALPAGCTDPGPTPYSGLTNGGTITVDFTLTCVAPPSLYILSGAWSGSGAAGSTRTYRLSFNTTTRDDPAIPGPDDIGTISGLTTYDAARLSFTGAANVAASLLANQAAAEPVSGTVAWLNFNSGATPATGAAVGVIDLNFTVDAGAAAGSFTPVTSFQAVDDVASLNGTDLKPFVQINDAALTLP